MQTQRMRRAAHMHLGLLLQEHALLIVTATNRLTGMYCSRGRHCLLPDLIGNTFSGDFILGDIKW